MSVFKGCVFPVDRALARAVRAGARGQARQPAQGGPRARGRPPPAPPHPPARALGKAPSGVARSGILGATTRYLGQNHLAHGRPGCTPRVRRLGHTPGSPPSLGRPRCVAPGSTRPEGGREGRPREVTPERYPPPSARVCPPDKRSDAPEGASGRGGGYGVVVLQMRLQSMGKSQRHGSPVH